MDFKNYSRNNNTSATVESNHIKKFDRFIFKPRVMRQFFELDIPVDEDDVAGKESYLITITFARRFFFSMIMSRLNE